jgi:sugar (pentulose or hexulose) kinase
VNSDPVYAGVDVGTQSLRVVVVDGSGNLIGRGDAPLRSVRGEGRRHEQDPEEWWQALGAAATAATEPLGGRTVAGIAVCSTSGTVLLADTSARPLTPALMYDDMRAGEQAARIRDTGHAVWRDLGYRMQPSWALPKVLWMLEHAAAPRQAVLMHSADLIAARLTGRWVATDTSHALKTGYDLLHDGWPHDALHELGVPAELLPDVVEPGTVLGQVTKNAAEHTGLTAGAPVMAGMTDGCASQIAAGALAAGSCNSVLGTTLVLKGVSADLVLDPDGVVYSHRHPDGGWLPAGASNVGAGAIASAFPGRDLAALDARAARYEPSAAVVYPLSATGERFPFDRPDARPFQLGQWRDEAERYAAVLQGVAFVERLGLAHFAGRGIDVSGALALTGGASRSRYWCQLRADVLGRTIVRRTRSDAALGMAIVAAADGASVTATAERMVPDGEEIEPRPDRIGRFENAYRRLVDELARRGYIAAELAAGA